MGDHPTAGILFNQFFEIMKTKILNALRTEYANLGLGDKAFDGVASFLEKTITEEGKIAEAIKEESVKNLLKSIQGESDSLRNRAAQAAKDLEDYKKTHPEATPTPQPTPAPTATQPQETENERKLREQMEKITERLERQEKAEKTKATLALVKAAAKAAGCTYDKALELTERLFSVKDDESDEDASKRFKDEYDANVKKYFSDGVTPFQGAYVSAPAVVKPEDKAARAREEAKRVRES